MYQPKTESIFFLLEFAGCADYDNKLIRVVYQYQLTSMVKYLSVTVRNYAESSPNFTLIDNTQSRLIAVFQLRSSMSRLERANEHRGGWERKKRRWKGGKIPGEGGRVHFSLLIVTGRLVVKFGKHPWKGNRMYLFGEWFKSTLTPEMYQQISWVTRSFRYCSSLVIYPLFAVPR